MKVASEMNALRIALFLGWLLLAWPHAVLASDLATRLASSEHVLLMRHAYAPGVGDPPGYSLERCETQRVLSDDGKRQSLRIGDWLRSQGVRAGRVLSSVWCRCQQTAERLNYGPIQVEASLGSFFDEPDKGAQQNKQMQQVIARELSGKAGKALILVTHHVNIREFVGENIGSGDMVLARVTPQGTLLDYRVIQSP
jgi:phosphohistidine phosphatase SixA